MLPAMTPALIPTSASVRFQPSVKYSNRRPSRISVARGAFWTRAFGIAEPVEIRSATEPADSKSNEHKVFQRVNDGFDLRRQLCYQSLDDSKNDGFCRNCSRVVCGDYPVACCTVYHHKHCEREAVRAWLLREQDLLRHFASTHWVGPSAAGENDFRPAKYRHNFCYHFHSAGDSASGPIGCLFQR